MHLPPVYVWIDCVLIGCFDALVATGYLIIQRGAGYFNFAIGAYSMVGGLGTAYFASQLGWPVVPAIIVGIVIAVILALLTEILVARPLHAKSPAQELPALIALAAVLYALEQGAGTAFGRNALPGVSWLPLTTYEWGHTPVQNDALFMIGMTIVILAALHLWSSRSKYGRLLNAVGDNKSAAEIIGLPVSSIRLVAFGIGGLLAALGGSLYAFQAGVSYDQGLNFALAGFLTLVISGRGSIWAPLVGGIAFAVMQQLSVFYFGGDAIDFATLIVALVFFAFRPNGIFVQRTARA